jgi:histidine ammonia-lyase
MLNADVVPVVPGRGSVGASGDTVLLAHMAAVLIGDGLAYTPSSGVVSGRDALESIDLEPLRLSPRDGLGMINGLDFTISQLVLTLRSLIRLADWAIAIAALTADLVGNSDDPFQLARSREYALSHQRAVADRIMVLIGDKSLERQRLSGQDPYSIRCVPQVLGSSISAIEYACEAVAEHLAAVVDNPIIDSQQNRVLHGGMFHGQHLAIVADFAAIATATMANVSHERIRLLLGGRALPEKQAYSPGLTNGLMMVETTTASLVAAIRAGVTPLSVHNVSATTAQEDHVSMAWEAARRLNTIVEDVRWVIAAEGLAASNGVRMVGANTLGAGTARVADRLLARAQLGEQDQEMTTALEDLANLIATEPFD